jgi:hypothetical protein
LYLIYKLEAEAAIFLRKAKEIAQDYAVNKIILLLSLMLYARLGKKSN